MQLQPALHHDVQFAYCKKGITIGIQTEAHELDLSRQIIKGLGFCFAKIGRRARVCRRQARFGDVGAPTYPHLLVFTASCISQLTTNCQPAFFSKRLINHPKAWNTIHF